MNTLVVAPTRTGKSTFAATVGMAMLHDPDAQVFSLDVDGDKSAIVPACLSAGGEFLTFLDGGAAMQPLSDLESEMGKEFSPAFLKFCCKVQGVEASLTPTQISNGVEAVLSVLQDEPVHRRTMAQAAKLAMYDEMTDAFRQYAEGGTWGRYTGGYKDVLGTSRWVTFELSNIMGKGEQAAPGIDCLFHKLEKRCDIGRGQTLIQGDEAWMLFREYPEKIDEYLRRLPKKHAGMMLLIHNLLDLGPLTHMMRENCKQKAFMANPSAVTPEGLRILADFNMNFQQATLIANARPKQDIYLVSDDGARLAHLNLPPIARVLCASGGPDNAARLRRLLSGGTANFGPRLLRDHGMHDEADRMESYSGGEYAYAAE
jgi:type IV secretion system protein VirB4